MFRCKLVAAVSFVLLLSACQKSAEEGGGDSGSGTKSGEATTDCGVVVNGKVTNPVKFEDGKTVKVTQVLSNNLVLIQDGKGSSQLLKLQGVSSSGAPSNKAMQIIKNMSSPDPVFFKATKDCNVSLQGGGTGTIGQLISQNGQSIAESLIRAGQVKVDSNDACSGNLIGTCLGALGETNSPPPSNGGDNGGGDNGGSDGNTDSIGEMEAFLWKPLSDTKGPVAVAMERHCDTTIKVNGQSMKLGGGGNGRCNTSVGTRSGCSYGKNIRVEVIDNRTGRPYTHNGQPYVIVPDGCSRFGFN